MSTKTKQALSTRVNLAEMDVNDIFSENIHLTYLGKEGNEYKFQHLEANVAVSLTEEYVTKLLTPADQYQSIMKVGREDKMWTAKQIEDAKSKGELAKDSPVRIGDLRVPGMRTVWEDIHSSDVIRVTYTKADKKLSAKELAAQREAQIKAALEKIETAQKSKKGVLEAAKVELAALQANPISGVVAGEERTLRGYKIQFTSRDGKYDCIDMDIKDGAPVRPVNINTITSLIYNGIKFVLEA